ncbi:hypothetical protein [Mesorhizobium sp.]|uniref:ATP-dependent DNA ligase n=1 Tax=Mesorhizobium sp. TaxID=1871066 RepID=UPI0025D7983E|nr:hypothetical protein [Mesorhizobium sp.]
MPLIDRREILEAMITRARAHPIQRGVAWTGTAVFHLVEQAGLEGIVSKRKESVYRNGNATAWLKAKAAYRSTTELLGVE